MRKIKKNSTIIHVPSDRLNDVDIDREVNIDYPISVNLVVTTKCNYNCRFCFGRYRSFLSNIDDSRIMEIPKLLANVGAQKITFEGGEPLCHPRLLELIVEAKKRGLITGLVANGNLLTKTYLRRLSGSLDWLGLSIDSASERVETELGRGFGNHVEHTLRIARWAYDMGINLKINSVVTKLNYRENMSSLIKRIAPVRFKAFQMLKIKGENDLSLKGLEISSKEFGIFVKNHIGLSNDGIDFIPETNDDMMGSYIMILPDGRFFNNSNHVHTYGDHTVFEIGAEKAFKSIKWNVRKFLDRGGLYKWDIKKRNIPNNTYHRRARVIGSLSDINYLKKEGENNGI